MQPIAKPGEQENRSYLIPLGGVQHFRMRVPKSPAPNPGQEEFHRNLAATDHRVPQSTAHAFYGRTGHFGTDFGFRTNFFRITS